MQYPGRLKSNAFTSEPDELSEHWLAACHERPALTDAAAAVGCVGSLLGVFHCPAAISQRQCVAISAGAILAAAPGWFSIRPPVQETGAENGWRTAAPLHKCEPVDAAKTKCQWRSPMKARDAESRTRNPFDVMDVPDPNDRDVLAFATGATLAGAADDENAQAWVAPSERDYSGAIEGNWSSRWNGGADPTIPGDAANKWKQGNATVKAVGDRLYLLFDWDNGERRGLIEAHREGTRLVGKYINLTDPKVTRPWIGLIVSNQRIDGRWTGGRLDFRR